MSTTFRPYAPDQSLLLPPDVREWLPEGHLAHHISDLVDDLDLTAFYAPYEGDGRRNAPYEPRMMVKVLLYAYATGVFSSRRVARRLEEDVAFRVLAAGNFPQHRTLCEFRRRHLEDFQALFVEVVRLAQELGLARLGKLSIDGTKVRANASKRKAMSYDRMQEEEQRLESEIEALLRKADAVDEAEDTRLGAEVRGDDLPAELHRREARLAAIRAAKARLEAKQRAADDARGGNGKQKRDPCGHVKRDPPVSVNSSVHDLLPWRLFRGCSDLADGLTLAVHIVTCALRSHSRARRVRLSADAPGGVRNRPP